MASTKGPSPEYILKERQTVIQPLAAKGSAKPEKRVDLKINPPDDVKILLNRLDRLLTQVDEEVQMTPQFKEKTKIHQGLQIISDATYGFPHEYVDRAKALLEKWESQNWGAPVVTKRESASESEGDAGMNNDNGGRSAKKRKLSATTDTGKLLLPKPGHPIWGLNGIMHGVCYMKTNGRKNPQLDDRYDHEKRSPSVRGHNGLTVGAWFPTQLVALFRGAHGSAQGGIHGTVKDGAYSVVVSGVYDDLDADHGNYLYYSGSGSHDNTDPKNPAEPKPGTRALRRSLETQQAVRVLRSSTGKSTFAPTKGCRYDGLYIVTEVKNAFNAKGGMYERFTLVRQENQKPIDRGRPTPHELRDFDQIGDGFVSDKGY